MPVEHNSTRKRLAKHTANGLYIAQHPAALDQSKTLQHRICCIKAGSNTGDSQEEPDPSYHPG